ncbi:MAG: tagaturonate reductase, partial [Pseudoflavonifractor sp.]
EVFGFWVIEGPQSIKAELPFEKAALPILVTDDHTPYKQRKVRILNGAHTSMIMAAYLAGQNIVRACMEDQTICGFMNKAIYDEIIPTLDLPKAELEDFAAAVTQRFNNPYIDHALLSISLNSTAKWKARVMPSLLEYRARTGKLATCLTFSFAAYLAFYHGGKTRGENCLLGQRGADTYEIKDDQWVLDFFYDHRDDDNAALAHAVIHNEKMWGDALVNLVGFEGTVATMLNMIDGAGMYKAIENCL